MKILAVEDDRAIAEMLKEGLEDESYAVDLAFDGYEGYLSATADEYDVIILDVMMPEMNGYELCKKTSGRKNHHANFNAYRKNTEQRCYSWFRWWSRRLSCEAI